MNTQTQGSGSFSPTDPPLKRKRGRPRKDESLVQAESTPTLQQSDSFKKSQQNIVTRSAVGSEMVGQVVSGVIEGSFDAGYLLKVKVGDSDTHLRGVVFLPGQLTPVSASNDVAPEAKMYKRTEIPIPASNLSIQQSAHVPLSEPIDKQLIELKTVESAAQDQRKRSELQFSVPSAQENRPTVILPSFSGNLPISSTEPSLGLKVLIQEVSESGNQSQPISIMTQMGNDKAVKKDEGLLDLKVPEKGPAVMFEATEESKSAPSVDIFPDTETVNLELQIQQQAVTDDLRQNQPNHDGAKSAMEHNLTPVISEPGNHSSEPIEINMWVEKQASPKGASTLDIPVNNNSVSDTFHPNGNPVKHAANIAESGLPLAPVTELPATLFEREAIVTLPGVPPEGSSLQKMIEPQFDYSNSLVKEGSNTALMTSLPVNFFDREAIASEPKIAAEVPVLPRMMEPQLCSSSNATNNVECSLTDRIRPAES